jgi:5'-3' exonuclease|tara:strand:+ start:8196 stop:9185 length:990 start_codon:yes stop_codon:yes gene_type:complete
MTTHILVDTANTFFRARHVIRGDLNEKIGMALHITFNSIRKVWRDFDGSHVVFCLEGRSWRKDHYAPYKRNRSDARAVRTETEVEEDEVFWETFDNFKNFIDEKTNCTVLRHENLEADDLIAGWIQAHPNDNHVVVSTDGDFAQLIAPNVKQFNGIQDITTTHEGYFDEKGKRVIDKKTKEEKPAPNPQWLLFEKCMRGDSSDNVFSAYPGVRTKGTKKKVGLLEAFADRESKGYNWNNLMLQRWVDHEGAEHRVLDDYQRNVKLCDLTAQPDEIQKIIKDTVASATEKQIEQVGLKLIKFCAKWDMQRIADSPESYAEPLNAKYKKGE